MLGQVHEILHFGKFLPWVEGWGHLMKNLDGPDLRANKMKWSLSWLLILCGICCQGHRLVCFWKWLWELDTINCASLRNWPQLGQIEKCRQGAFGIGKSWEKVINNGLKLICCNCLLCNRVRTLKALLRISHLHLNTLILDYDWRTKAVSCLKSSSQKTWRQEMGEGDFM